MAEKGSISIHTENIFPIIKKWLYSEKEIFLRELIANGVDAISKLQHINLVEGLGLSEDFHIDLIIDKDAARQALSEHEPWEQWFHADEVATWLRRHCDDVRVEHISHGGGAGGSGLFLAASSLLRRTALGPRQA